MRLLFATTNPHKIREVAQILADVGVVLVSLDSLAGNFDEPEETGTTFAENARIKAIAYAKAAGMTCLAEDSGLEVDALCGAPGVHSARYSGSSGARSERDALNNQKLLSEMQGVPAAKRAARFVCALCVAQQDGAVVAEAQGFFEGEIADTLRGENGFGYDPLLYLPELGCTSAQLSAEQKNARSHRGVAVRKLALLLKNRTILTPFTPQ